MPEVLKTKTGRAVGDDTTLTAPGSDESWYSKTVDEATRETRRIPFQPSATVPPTMPSTSTRSPTARPCADEVVIEAVVMPPEVERVGVPEMLTVPFPRTTCTRTLAPSVSFQKPPKPEAKGRASVRSRVA